MGGVLVPRLDQQPLPLHVDQHFVAFEISVCALAGALVMQLSSQLVFWLHAWMQEMICVHAESLAHACVTEQQLDWMQLAQLADLNEMPQA